MTIPTATYRLQFRNGMTFENAIEILPHLKRLGISHVYASPIFTATAGSTHGYDVTDANEIDPAIGGRTGFDAFSAALRGLGLGLIIDIVPNHMAASVENAWWRDVLRHGPNSAYARHFDIDWSERLTLPQLGRPFAEAADAGEFELVKSADGDFHLRYFDTDYPLNPESIAFLSRETNGEETALAQFARDPAALQRLHEMQHWVLTHWKEAARHLSYRRFFEVTGLVGMRVEDEAVFDDMHRLILELVRSGRVQGLRVDHVDGLADPKTYLQRLRRSAGEDTYIIVEKILGPDEKLPTDWPISGTTGYEFIEALSALFIDASGLQEMDRHYRDLSPDTADFKEGLRAAKMAMVERNFEGEVARLVKIVGRILPTLPSADVAKALQELLVAFPVYRTYGTTGPLSAQDETVLTKVMTDASGKMSNPRVLHQIGALLHGEGAASSPDVDEFRLRFQQLSGPVMAKAMEDTLFYRYNRLLAANEVGGEPDKKPGGVETFHRLMQDRQKSQPHGLTSTSTHDTKRGEDARARLYALSEGAGTWNFAVERWRRSNAHLRIALPDGVAPEPNTEWMLYQALAGMLPASFEDGDLSSLSERFTAYIEKAAREAKCRTEWGNENEDYESAIKGYAAGLLLQGNKAFLDDFSAEIEPFITAGVVNSLSQTLIKLTAPGIPDIYQGTEGFDLSLVDPDNRRPIDYGVLQLVRDGSNRGEQPTMEQLKLQVIERALAVRTQRPDLFSAGDYVPLRANGPRRDHLIAFARTSGSDFAITVAPRMMHRKTDTGSFTADRSFWLDTVVILPADLQRRSRDRISGSEFEAGKATLDIASLLAKAPVALIVP